MNNIQYTIRNIPEPVDEVLRQKALKQGKSFNQTVVDTLKEATIKPSDIKNELSWFIGSGKNMNKSDRKAEDEAYAWLNNLPGDLETFDD